MRNPRVKRLGRLARQRSARDEASVFVADGPVLVTDAAQAGLSVHEVFVEHGARHRPDVVGAAEAAMATGASGFVLDATLHGNAGTVTPNGIAAVVRRPDPAPTKTPSSADDLLILLVDVSDPGNVGTLVRVAEVCGASSVVVAGASADPWSPKCIRASAGSAFRVPIQPMACAADALRGVGERGYQLIGTRGDAGTNLGETTLTGLVALVLGNEAHGLPPHLDPLLDAVVAIPMAGRAESLNVAMAGAILGFEVFREQLANQDR